jgi:iron-sulfur cluster insertion protein
MTTHPLIFTHHAAAKVWELIQEEGNLNLKLRVYVTGGGCSGFQYGFTFDEAIQEDDTVISRRVKSSLEKEEEEEEDEEGGEGAKTVQLLVDPLSFQYLAGAEIDYKEDMEGEQFIIRNPNAKTTCGCGSSFTTE